jgi:tetratricopeptide (TPR) repeat protein
MLLESVNETKAEEHYRAALQALPSYAQAHNNLAILLNERGDLQRAEEHYLAALRLRPRDPQTNYNFALYLQAKGRTYPMLRPNVRFGSLADIEAAPPDVRFTPKSRRRLSALECPLYASRSIRIGWRQLF